MFGHVFRQSQIACVTNGTLSRTGESNHFEPSKEKSSVQSRQLMWVKTVFQKTKKRLHSGTFFSGDTWKYATREGDSRVVSRIDEFFVMLQHSRDARLCDSVGGIGKLRDISASSDHNAVRVLCWQKGALHNPHDVVADPTCRHDTYARSGMRSTNSIGTDESFEASRLPKVDPLNRS